jgi:hypothetical protein
VQIAAVKNCEQKNSATSGKTITAVNVSYGYVYIFVQVGQVGCGVGVWGAMSDKFVSKAVDEKEGWAGC